uniref:Uncharacterized protein n=1 Tax=Acrobeloides nanus TaxID=290746 RepID=A0A914DGY8_9BILA
MKDQNSAFKLWVDIILFMFSGLSRMQPLRRKTLMRDLSNVAKLLATLAIFPILNFIFFGHKDPNPLQYDMEPEALKQALQRSWEMVHDRRGDDPIPPCPWVENT